jgi:hypothetical protein
MTTIYYKTTDNNRRLVPAPDVLETTVNGCPVKIAGPKSDVLIANGYHTLFEEPAPVPPEGKVAVFDGYTLDETDGKWHAQYHIEDEPLPTLDEYDREMEEHLRRECVERGYTKREPDAYLMSQNPRWAQDARDWVPHRDAVMDYGLTLINEVAAGKRPHPTMAEFRAGLEPIVWTYNEET